MSKTSPRAAIIASELPDCEWQSFLYEMTWTLIRMRDFDDAWEIANGVCDRYGIGRTAS